MADVREMVIQVVVEDVRYGGDGGWTVTKCVYDQPAPAGAAITGGLFALVGDMGPVRRGDVLRCIGSFINNRTFGLQFKARSAVPIVGKTKSDLIAFLTHMPNIGPVRAEKAVKALGREGVIDALTNDPNRLADAVPRLSRAKAHEAAEMFRNRLGEADAFMFLAGDLGLGEISVARALKEWGAGARRVITEDPYVLSDLHGIGFKRADEVARSKLDMGADDPRRLAAAAEVAVQVMAFDEGNTRGLLYQFAHHKRVARETSVSPEDILKGLSILEGVRKTPTGEKGPVVRRILGNGPEKILAITGLDNAEKRIAREVYRLLAGGGGAVDPGLEIPDSGLWTGVKPDRHQLMALGHVAAYRVSVVTGNPGTGKTTLLSAVLKLLQHNGLVPVCCAPTGRAARRMEEATGVEATTIHRLLKYHPRFGFRHSDQPPVTDKDSGAWLHGGPIEADCVVLDEASMCDVVLVSALLRGLPEGCRLIIVGDIDQLPSIGPGQVLDDVIASGVVPVVRLQQIHRQESESRIPYAARDIIAGKVPDFDDVMSDIQFLEVDDAAQAASFVVSVVGDVLPQPHADRGRRAFAASEVQVIAPMKRGVLGVEALNIALQAKLNPGEAGLRIGARYSARPGDRVLQTRNNYDIDVMNGEIGILRAYDLKGLPPSTLASLGVVKRSQGTGGALGLGKTASKVERPTAVVEFPSIGAVAYRFADLNDLILGYACTMHKFQGSQAPCVVLPVHEQHSFMLTRRLLYTAVTRGAEFVVLVGSRTALKRAVNNNRDAVRQTGLATYLLEGDTHASDTDDTDDTVHSPHARLSF